MSIDEVIDKIKSLCKTKGEDFVHEDHGVIKVYDFRQIDRMLYPFTGDITISRFEAVAFPYCIEFSFGGQPIKAFLDRTELSTLVGVDKAALIRCKLYGFESTPASKLTIKLNRVNRRYYENTELAKWHSDNA